MLFQNTLSGHFYEGGNRHENRTYGVTSSGKKRFQLLTPNWTDHFKWVAHHQQKYEKYPTCRAKLKNTFNFLHLEEDLRKDL